MRKLMIISAFILLVSIPARAQDSYPTVEVFGGYSYFSADVSFDDPFDDDGDDFFDQREGFHGVGFSIAGNLSRSIGLVADFSYHKKELDVPFFAEEIDSSAFTFLFGPRFTARGDRVDAFGHVLIGGVRTKTEEFDSETSLALGVGGGIDIKATDKFAVRLIQLDYIPVRAEGPFGDKEWFHNLRFQIGGVLRW